MPYQIATSFFKFLRSDPSLLSLIEEDLSMLEDIDFKAPYVSGDKLEQVFDIAARNGIESWLLSTSNSLSAASHGAFGFAILCAPDLNTALELMVDYAQIRASNITISLDRQAQYAYLIADCDNPSERSERWILECAVYSALALFKEVLSQAVVQHAHVNFSFPKPSYAKELEQLLGVECQYDQKQTNIRFASSWCRMPSPHSDSDIHKINIQRCRKLKLQLESKDNGIQHLKLTLDSYFSARAIGKASGHNVPTLEMVANDLNISSRTLARRLEDEQTSYKHELLLARKKVAQQLLSTTHLKIAQIAEILAYQETSNFVRAFKTWFDIPPSEWRRNLND